MLNSQKSFSFCLSLSPPPQRKILLLATIASYGTYEEDLLHFTGFLPIKAVFCTHAYIKRLLSEQSENPPCFACCLSKAGKATESLFLRFFSFAGEKCVNVNGDEFLTFPTFLSCFYPPFSPPRAPPSPSSFTPPRDQFVRERFFFALTTHTLTSLSFSRHLPCRKA